MLPLVRVACLALNSRFKGQKGQGMGELKGTAKSSQHIVPVIKLLLLQCQIKNS